MVQPAIYSYPPHHPVHHRTFAARVIGGTFPHIMPEEKPASRNTAKMESTARACWSRWTLKSGISVDWEYLPLEKIVAYVPLWAKDARRKNGQLLSAGSLKSYIDSMNRSWSRVQRKQNGDHTNVISLWSGQVGRVLRSIVSLRDAAIRREEMELNGRFGADMVNLSKHITRFEGGGCCQCSEKKGCSKTKKMKYAEMYPSSCNTSDTSSEPTDPDTETDDEHTSRPKKRSRQIKSEPILVSKKEPLPLDLPKLQTQSEIFDVSETLVLQPIVKQEIFVEAMPMPAMGVYVHSPSNNHNDGLDGHTETTNDDSDTASDDYEKEASNDSVIRTSVGLLGLLELCTGQLGEQ